MRSSSCLIAGRKTFQDIPFLFPTAFLVPSSPDSTPFVSRHVSPSDSRVENRRHFPPSRSPVGIICPERDSRVLSFSVHPRQFNSLVGRDMTYSSAVALLHAPPPSLVLYYYSPSLPLHSFYTFRDIHSQKGSPIRYDGDVYRKPTAGLSAGSLSPRCRSAELLISNRVRLIQV